MKIAVGAPSACVHVLALAASSGHAADCSVLEGADWELVLMKSRMMGKRAAGLPDLRGSGS